MLNFGNNILQFNVCYVLHALCCHFHYSLHDVLRMNGFTLAVHLEYEHTYGKESLKTLKEQIKEDGLPKDMFDD